MTESEKSTREHIKNVGSKLELILCELGARAIVHDQSKLEEPELSTFEIYTEKLKGSTYGSEEYKQFLVEMKPALDHHYANNSHHPEFHEKGVSGMTLIDLVEMFCDWISATERHEDGDIFKSIKHNKDRFEISEQLCSIFENTAIEIFGKEKKS